MKRVVSVLFLFLMTIMLSSLPYHKKCKECIREQKENKNCMCEIGIAWRDFGTPIIHKNGKAYVTYRCQYGHSFLVCLND